MLFKNIRGLKIISKCTSITKQEKSILIIKGLIENLVNSYKLLLRLPFLLLGFICIFFYWLFNGLTQAFDLLQDIFNTIQISIDNNFKDLNITKGKARDKVLQEIKNKYQ